MSSLRKPPSEHRPSRGPLLLVFLLVLILIVGIVIYTAVTDQQINAIESTRADSVQRDVTVVSGLAVRVIEDSTGGNSVLILHDDQIAGSVTTADLSTAIGDAYRRVRVDLPGFGLSDRMTQEGRGHTATGMAERVSTVITERSLDPVIVVGIGFGGQVAADLAFLYPELVGGLVLVDVDFDPPRTFDESLQSLPLVGKAATYTWETSGRLAVDKWAPFCDDGGWCPTASQLAERSTVLSIAGTTASIHAFRNTPPAAAAPSNLAEIEAPIVYVWSTEGKVGEDALGKIQEELPDLAIVRSDTHQVHLEDPQVVATALEALGG